MEPVENTWAKTSQNFCSQIEVLIIVEWFLIGKSWDFQQINIKSLELPNYTYTALVASPTMIPT